MNSGIHRPIVAFVLGTMLWLFVWHRLDYMVYFVVYLMGMFVWGAVVNASVGFLAFYFLFHFLAAFLQAVPESCGADVKRGRRVHRTTTPGRAGRLAENRTARFRKRTNRQRS